MRPRRHDSQLAKHVLCVGPGASADGHPLELALDPLGVEVEEVEPPGLHPAGTDVGEKAVERPLRDRAAAEPGDDVVDARRQTREREPDVLAPGGVAPERWTPVFM